MRKLISIGLILICGSALGQKQITLYKSKERVAPPFLVKGTIYSSATGEPLPGATVYLVRQQQGTTADAEGAYRLELYQGVYHLQVSTVGYVTETLIVNVLGPGTIDFLLNENVTELSAVTISAEGEDANVSGKDIGKNTLNIESIKSLPPLAGEVDILKSLTLLPGVSTIGEASSGFNVRGGGSDQNLILLGGATLYNPSHLFGFLSAFNPSVIRDVELYKGAIPANYGGRGSSIVDVGYKKGNFSEWDGEVSIGMISSRMGVGGPIIPGKLSTRVGGRIAYPNHLLRLTKDAEIKDGVAKFYDANIIMNYAINDNHELEASAYQSFDEFLFTRDTSNTWGNQSMTLKWSGQLTPRISSSVMAVHNQYDAAIIGDASFESFELENGITDQGVKGQLNVEPNDQHNIIIGAEAKKLNIALGTLSPGRNSALNPADAGEENGIESGLFFQHDMDITPTIGVSYGLRYSDFRLFGPGEIYTYDEFNVRRLENVISTREYGDSDEIVNYSGLEPRGSVRVNLSETSSVKVGYNRMIQYIHQITNTTSISPVDIWKLSDPFLEPQFVSQYSAGYFQNFQNNRIETSLEVYYKDWDNVVEYIDGADLFLNEHLETELLSGFGRSYGMELYLKKNQGRLNGWVSYTYSRSLRQVLGAFEETTVNDGKWYPSNFDRPHDFTSVLKYRLGPLSVASMIFTFGSGRPVTYPTAKFNYTGEIQGYFNERNGNRAPAFHRLDLGLKFKLKTDSFWASGDWNLSIYNVYGRKNAFSVFFRDFLGAPPQPYQLTIVGAPFPSLSYELSF